jgi:hypothetical protein
VRCLAAGASSGWALIAVSLHTRVPNTHARRPTSACSHAPQVGGNWLAWWIVLAAAASQIGQFQAEMSSDSYQLQGMAERGFLPKVGVCVCWSPTWCVCSVYAPQCLGCCRHPRWRV